MMASLTLSLYLQPAWHPQHVTTWPRSVSTLGLHGPSQTSPMPSRQREHLRLLLYLHSQTSHSTNLEHSWLLTFRLRLASQFNTPHSSFLVIFFSFGTPIISLILSAYSFPISMLFLSACVIRQLQQRDKQNISMPFSN